MRIERYERTRYWAVRGADGTLLCLCVYKRGAVEVVRRLQAMDDAQQWQDSHYPAEDVKGPVTACNLFDL